MLVLFWYFNEKLMSGKANQDGLQGPDYIHKRAFFPRASVAMFSSLVLYWYFKIEAKSAVDIR